MITLNDISFSYTGREPFILKEICFSIEDGEYISVLGENGSGKTTLMRLILGFLKPIKGQIQMENVKIGYVPQKNEFAHAGFPITVAEMMHSYEKIQLRSRKTKTRRALEKGMDSDYKQILEEMELSHLSQQLVGNLSGGQLQKLFIARALIGNPGLLILDEPSTGIDLNNRKEIYQLLRKINKEKKITVISVEHNLEAALANSTKIYHIQEGSGHLCSPKQFAKEFLQSQEEG